MRRIIILFSALLFLSSCGNLSSSASKIYNEPSKDEIHIGVAYPAEIQDMDTYFYKGVKLAVDTVNENGGVLGKTLDTVIRDDKNDTNMAMQIAQTFYEQGITAVIGHWSTNVCYFVEDVYERNKVVMLTPDATGLNIFENEYKYIYRMIPNNRDFSKTVASYMDERSFKRVAIYFSDDEYGRNFADIIENELVKHRIKVVDRVTGITSANVESVLARWNAFGCDGIFMACTFPDYMEPIRLIRDSHNQIPIFGADNFERATFSTILGRSTEGIYKTVYRNEDLDQEFLSAFRARFGHEPDIQAITGYECVYLLKDAMEASGTTDSTAIAEYLSSLKGYRTISGVRTYNPDTQEFEGCEVYVSEIKGVDN